MHSNQCLHIISRALPTIQSMLTLRNYDASMLSSLSSKELSKILQENDSSEELHIRIPSNDDKSFCLLVFTTSSKQLKKTNVKKIVCPSDSDDNDTLKSIRKGEGEIMIFCFGDISDSIQSHISQTVTQGVRIQVFSIESLLFNILDHSLVPQHRRLNQSEIEHICELYNVKGKHQFPAIKLHDPVGKFIGLYPGDVCEIIRDSKTNGTAVMYRHCVL